MTELETLQAELDTINQQIQSIMNPRIAAKKAAMTEGQKIQNLQSAINTANQILTSLQNN
jgi:peptidoglycan hydrolase CwlO-like protein